MITDGCLLHKTTSTVISVLIRQKQDEDTVIADNIVWTSTNRAYLDAVSDPFIL